MRLLSFLNETNTQDVNDFTLVEMRLFELRNVLNTDEITDWSKERSRIVATRITDNPELQATIFNWMSKALRKYILTKVRGENVGMFAGNETYYTRNKSGPVSELPPWAQKELLSGEELLYINPDTVTVGMNVPKEVTLVRDWLRYKLRENPEQITPNRLSRISFENALQLSDDYHQELKRKRPASEEEVRKWWSGTDDERGVGWFSLEPADKHKIYKEFTKLTGRPVAGVEDTPEGHKLVKEYNTGNKWVSLTTQSCLDYEGNRMGHCVAGYGSDVESGYVDIISLRDKNNEPHATIELANGSGTVSQIKGKGNKPPVMKYIPYVVDMLNIIYDKYGTIKFSNEGEEDLYGMGMIYEKTTYNEGAVGVISPPFAEPDKFVAEFIRDDGNYEEETFEGSVEEIIERVSDDYFVNINASDIIYIFNKIIAVGEWTEDTEYGGDLTISYNGTDRDERRTLKTVVPS